MPFSFLLRRLLVGVALAAVIAPASAAADWVRVETPDFVVIYLTYRASFRGQAGLDGQIAAVEFLPR